MRKEIHDLTKEEFKKVSDAINTLKRNGLWEQFSEIHSMPGWNIAHGRSSHFFHWHRRFLYLVETALIYASNDCSIALPYWDWALESANPGNSEVFEDHYYGDNRSDLGTQDDPQCIRSGPFAGWRRTRNEQTWWRNAESGDRYDGCIRRKWRNRTFSTSARIETFKRRSSINLFQSGMEAAHGGVHCAIGGHMCAGGLGTTGMPLAGLSPYDPIFHLHHAQVDKVWEDYQNINSRNRNAVNSRVNRATLDGFVKHSGLHFEASEMSESENLRLDPTDDVSWGVVYQEPRKLLVKLDDMSSNGRRRMEGVSWNGLGNSTLYREQVEANTFTASQRADDVDDEDLDNGYVDGEGNYAAFPSDFGDAPFFDAGGYQQASPLVADQVLCMLKELGSESLCKIPPTIAPVQIEVQLTFFEKMRDTCIAMNNDHTNLDLMKQEILTDLLEEQKQWNEIGHEPQNLLDERTGVDTEVVMELYQERGLTKCIS